ncbi:MAG: iron-containing redox enzyme family protein [Actinomycetota bacterium]
MNLPSARGPLTEGLFDALVLAPADLPVPDDVGDNALFSDDLQLALHVCYELHYRGFDDVSDEWEWHPPLIAYRRRLEDAFERELIDKLGVLEAEPAEVVARLKEIADRSDGPSLSRFLETEATVEQFREFVIHRSIYHLREADPHTWVIPRLAGRPKAALVEVQSDEYGGGDPTRMHAVLFADLMSGLGLDATYGAYLDRVPATTLATNNLMSMFGLARKRRGAAIGHLALLEMDSSIPNARYSAGLARLGLPKEARRFFDEHVEADSVHEAIAANDLAGGLAGQEPGLAAHIVFGAEALYFVDGYFAAHLLTAWEEGRSSLRLSR